MEADSIEAKTTNEIRTQVQVVAAKSKTKSKVKTAKPKSKEKTPCKYCEKLFIYPDKHEKNCKVKAAITTSQLGETIAIKA